MQATCPHCRQTVIRDANSAGHVVACPRCGQDFQVPGFEVKSTNVPLWVYGVVVFMVIALSFWWI